MTWRNATATKSTIGIWTPELICRWLPNFRTWSKTSSIKSSNCQILSLCVSISHSLSFYVLLRCAVKIRICIEVFVSDSMCTYYTKSEFCLKKVSHRNLKFFSLATQNVFLHGMHLLALKYRVPSIGLGRTKLSEHSNLWIIHFLIL